MFAIRWSQHRPNVRLDWPVVARALATIAAFALCTTIALGGGMTQATNKELGVSAKETTPIGHLTWEITETSTGKTIAKDNRTITANEVEVISDPRGYLEQRIPLTDPFFLKLNSGRSEEPFQGFGITAAKQDQATFSWEWFTVTTPTSARKLQESGTLEYRAETIGDMWEIVHTQFVTDISLRVRDMKDTAGEDPTWRVRILKGSEVEWPVLARERVVLAKDANAWIATHPPAPTFWESLVQVAEESSPTGTRK